MNLCSSYFKDSLAKRVKARVDPNKKSDQSTDKCKNRRNSESRLMPSIGENAYQIAASELKYSQAERLVKKILSQNGSGLDKKLQEDVESLKEKHHNESLNETRHAKRHSGKWDKMQEAIKATINKIENKLNSFHGKSYLMGKLMPILMEFIFSKR